MEIKSAGKERGREGQEKESFQRNDFVDAVGEWRTTVEGPSEKGVFD